MRTGGSRRSWRSAVTACVLAAGVVLPAAARSPSDPAGSAATVATAQSQYESLLACPTTLDHIGRVVIPVMVDGRGPFRFVVDSGASHSTVSPGLARTLGLKMSKVPLIDLEGVTGSAAVLAVKLRALKAGSLVIHDTMVPVLRTPMMAGADGILGIAGLPHLTLLVNFARNRVRIARELEPDVRFDYSRVHTRLVSGGLMAIDAYVGNVPTLAIVDTGAQRSLGNPALRAALHLDDGPGPLEPVAAVYGATKQVQMGRMAGSPTIAIGPLRVNGVDLIYGKFHIFKVWGVDNRPAMILGMDVLGTVDALGFDFMRHELFVSGARRQGNYRFRTRAYQIGSKAIH